MVYQTIEVVLHCILKIYPRLVDPKVKRFEYGSPMLTGHSSGSENWQRKSRRFQNWECSGNPPGYIVKLTVNPG